VLKQQRQVRKMLADLEYRDLFEKVVTLIYHCSVKFSNKIAGKFIVQQKHWVVERAISGNEQSLGLRRFSKDFEKKCIYSQNTIRISTITLKLKQFH
jgi:hypothetical protein